MFLRTIVFLSKGNANRRRPGCVRTSRELGMRPQRSDRTAPFRIPRVGDGVWPARRAFPARLPGGIDRFQRAGPAPGGFRRGNGVLQAPGGVRRGHERRYRTGNGTVQRAVARHPGEFARSDGSRQLHRPNDARTGDSGCLVDGGRTSSSLGHPLLSECQVLGRLRNRFGRADSFFPSEPCARPIFFFLKETTYNGDRIRFRVVVNVYIF